MTGRAAVLFEKFVSVKLLRAQRRRIAFQVEVEPRIGREQRFFVFGDGVRDGFARVAFRVNGGESVRKDFVRFQFPDDFVPRRAGHFDRVQRRAAGLFGKIRRPAVPELHEVVDGIEHGRGVDAAELLAHSFRVRFVVDAAGLQVMARRARNRVVRRQPRIVVQHFAECDFADVHRDRIGDRLDGFVGENGRRQVIRIVFRPVFFHPIEQDLLFGVGKRRSPVHEVVFGHRHRAVGNRFFDFRQGDFADRPAVRKRPVRFRQVGVFERLGYVFLDDIACDRQAGIEGQVRCRAVAVQTAAVVEDRFYPHFGRQFGSRNPVHRMIGDRQRDSDYRQRQNDFYAFFHFLFGFIAVNPVCKYGLMGVKISRLSEISNKKIISFGKISRRRLFGSAHRFRRSPGRKCRLREYRPSTSVASMFRN